MSKKIMVSALEVSADMHLAHLVSAIKRKRSDIDIFGYAGHLCRELGVKIIADITNKGTVGFIEPLLNVPALIYYLKKAEKMLREEKPDLLLVVDGQGFNMPLAKYARKIGIPVVYYIAPQEWQWGTEAGGRKVLESVDVVLAIFKDEAEFYKRLGGTAYFNGHPLLDIVRPKLSRTEFFERNGLDLTRPVVGLFPGSRKQELRYILPVLEGCAEILKKERPEIQCLFSAATPRCAEHLKKHTTGLPVLQGSNYDIMANSDLLVMASGTTSLEASCLLRPMIVLYKFSAFSHWFIKTTVGHRLPKFFALPNLWLNKMAVPEFIQYGVEPRNVADNVIKFFEEPQLGKNMIEDLKNLNQVLGEKGSLEKNADVVIGLLK
jgi:lipid-A-disaccharide synthase